MHHTYLHYPTPAATTPSIPPLQYLPKRLSSPTPLSATFQLAAQLPGGLYFCRVKPQQKENVWDGERGWGVGGVCYALVLLSLANSCFFDCF